MVFIPCIYYLKFLLLLNLLHKVDCYYYHQPSYTANVWSDYTYTPTGKMPEFSPKDFVDNLVKQHKVVVFSKSYCPYCTRAKNALNGLNLGDVYVEELDSHDHMDAVQDYLEELTGARSVPRVFVNGKFYGDSSKTVADVESGTFMNHFKSTEL